LIDTALMKEISEIFIFLSDKKMGKDDVNCRAQLEKEIVQQTANFYSAVSTDYIQSLSFPEYIE